MSLVLSERRTTPRFPSVPGRPTRAGTALSGKPCPDSDCPGASLKSVLRFKVLRGQGHSQGHSKVRRHPSSKQIQSSLPALPPAQLLSSRSARRREDADAGTPAGSLHSGDLKVKKRHGCAVPARALLPLRPGSPQLLRRGIRDPRVWGLLL